MADPWAEPVGSQGGWGTAPSTQASTPRRTSIRASMQNLAGDAENVPLSALAGRSGRTPSKRMTMGGPTMVPYRGGPGSPQGSPLANRSNYGAQNSPPSAPPSYAEPAGAGVRTRSMGPPPAVASRPPVARGEVSDGSGDPWGAGTNWQADSATAKAQAQRRRQTSYVPGTGSMAPPFAAGHHSRGAGHAHPTYSGRPSTGSSRAGPGPGPGPGEDEFHSVPSSPWGSPAKATGVALHGDASSQSHAGYAQTLSPPSAPPPPGGSQARWPGAGAKHGYGTPARLDRDGAHYSTVPERERSVSAPVTRQGSPDQGPRDEDGRDPYRDARGGSGDDNRDANGERNYGRGAYSRGDARAAHAPRHIRSDSGSGEYPVGRDSSARATPVAAQKVTAPPLSPMRPVGTYGGVHATQNVPGRDGVSQSLYAGPNAHAGAPATNPLVLAGAAPEGCYLGGWRGDERARILAYEACLQACLEGSLGSNAPQHKVDMAVHFLADRCAELRRGFGMDGILVGSRGNAGTLLGAAKDPKDAKAPAGRDQAKQGPDLGVGGQRWAGVTVDVTEVSITTRGWKRFTGGVNPRDIYAAVKGRSAHATANVETATPHARGDICRVRACSSGPVSSGGDSVMLHVGCGDARIKLTAADDALAFEVDLGGGKLAFCKPSLEDVSRMAGEGRNIVELPLKYATGKEKGYLRFTAHLEPIGGYDWGAPLTALDHSAGEHRGDVGGAGFGSAVEGNGWSAAGNGPLPPSAAYDVALNAALRALGFHRRRLQLHGPWAWLLRELSELQGVSPNHTSLRYVRHVLAVATPTADCLASILDHLAPCLREHASGSLTATETNQMDGIRVAVEQLVAVCFQNYKNLSEDEPRGIAKQVPELQPAPALAIAVELNRILQKDPAAPEALRAFTSHLQTAARACYRRHHSVFLGDRGRNESGSRGDADETSSAHDAGHARLFAGLSQMCLGLCRELGVDHTIADAEVLPGGVRLPQIAAGVYCVEASACVSKMLSANPPPAPPGAEAIDLVDALCELQEAAVAADVSVSPEAPFAVSRGEAGTTRAPHSGHQPPYPGANGALAAPALDPKAIFAPYVACWIEAARETLLHACVSALGTHGVGGAAMDAAYREAHAALEGFERVVSRWPDTAVNLEEVLADADRLLLHRISAAADENKQAAAGGLFRGYAPAAVARQDAGPGGGTRASARFARGHPGTVRESVRFTGRQLQRAPAFGHNVREFTAAPGAALQEEGLASPGGKHGAGAMPRLRAGKAAAAAALRQARLKVNRGTDAKSALGSPGSAAEGYVPVELAAALTALKAMEVLRPEVGQRLVLWVAAGGGGKSAAGEEFGRRSAEVLGELRAQYAGHLRRAVALVASAGPSLLEALRASATRPVPSARPARRAAGAFGRGAAEAERFARSPVASPGRVGKPFGDGDAPSDAEEEGGLSDAGGPIDPEASAEAASRDELDAAVAPVLAHVETVVEGLQNAIPQRRALVGVLRGLWSHLGAEALKFVEEDLRQRSSWRLRLMATGASDRVSVAISGAIRDALGHDVKEKDLEPPQSVKKLADFMSGSAEESISVY